MKQVRVLSIRPNEKPVVKMIDNDLKSAQNEVSDHGEDALIEITFPFDEDVLVVGNDEAKLIGMQGNRRIGHSIYAGPIFLVREDEEGNFESLTDEDIEKYSKMFAEPEDISDDEVQADCGFTIFGF